MRNYFWLFVLASTYQVFAINPYDFFRSDDQADPKKSRLGLWTVDLIIYQVSENQILGSSSRAGNHQDLAAGQVEGATLNATGGGCEVSIHAALNRNRRSIMFGECEVIWVAD